MKRQREPGHADIGNASRKARGLCTLFSNFIQVKDRRIDMLDENKIVVGLRAGPVELSVALDFNRLELLGGGEFFEDCNEFLGIFSCSLQDLLQRASSARNHERFQ